MTYELDTFSLGEMVQLATSFQNSEFGPKMVQYGSVRDERVGVVGTQDGEGAALEKVPGMAITEEEGQNSDGEGGRPVYVRSV